MRIAITGSSGLVGSYVTKRALDDGHTVLGLDIAAPPSSDPDDTTAATIQSSRVSASSFCFNTVDLTNCEQVLNNLEGCDAVIHCAAVPTAGTRPDAFVHNTNVCASYNVLRACAELGINRITQLSSVNAIGGVYTPYLRRYHFLPLDETHPYEPADPYALSKMICELQADATVRAFPNLRVASIRPHACLVNRPGNPDGDPYVAKYGRSKEHFGEKNINDCWGWVLMDSVAEACLLGLTSEGWQGHEAFYIAAPTTTVAEELGRDGPSSLDMAQKYHQHAKLKEGYYEGDRNRGRGFFDTSKAERILGWKHPA